jgi:hypothetical protein
MIELPLAIGGESFLGDCNATVFVFSPAIVAASIIVKPAFSISKEAFSGDSATTLGTLNVFGADDFGAGDGDGAPKTNLTTRPLVMSSTMMAATIHQGNESL